MYKDKKILAMIPARHGSKGLPGKNIRKLQGKPLLSWSVLQAVKSHHIDYVYLSSDSEAFSEIGIEYGANVPFLRPAELAQDDTPIAEVILYTLSQFENMGKYFDFFILLEPTTPFRKKGDIDKSIEQIINHPTAETLVSVGEIHLEHPWLVKEIDREGFMRPYVKASKNIYQRQQADRALFPYGVIYISKVNVFKEKKSFYTNKTIPFFTERWQNFEIDDELDFKITEIIFELNRGEMDG